MDQTQLQDYLSPAEFIDSDNQEVIHFTIQNTQETDSIKEKLIALYYAVRDSFRYDPYTVDLSRKAVKASNIVKRDYGYCVEKSCLYAAGARVLGVPSRMGFANVKNHVGTAKLEEILQTDVLVFHGYAEIYLDDRWIKVTPVFNESLCNKLNVTPLEFDGESDAVFQEYDKEGEQFMQYLHDYGTFRDVPYDMFISELHRHYPHLSETIFKTR